MIQTTATCCGGNRPPCERLELIKYGNNLIKKFAEKSLKKGKPQLLNGCLQLHCKILIEGLENECSILILCLEF